MRDVESPVGTRGGDKKEVLDGEEIDAKEGEGDNVEVKSLLLLLV